MTKQITDDPLFENYLALATAILSPVYISPDEAIKSVFCKNNRVKVTKKILLAGYELSRYNENSLEKVKSYYDSKLYPLIKCVADFINALDKKLEGININSLEDFFVEVSIIKQESSKMKKRGGLHLVEIKKRQ